MRLRAAAVVTILAAYAFLSALALAAGTLKHSYYHWLAGLGSDPLSLPVLTAGIAMPLVGYREHSTTGPWLTWLVWGSVSIWPAVAGIVVARQDLPPSSLASLMVPWLLLVLALSVAAAVGLWLPFSLF